MLLERSVVGKTGVRDLRSHVEGVVDSVFWIRSCSYESADMGMKVLQGSKQR